MTPEEISIQRRVRLFTYLLILHALIVCYLPGMVLCIRGAENHKCHGLWPQGGSILEKETHE